MKTVQSDERSACLSMNFSGRWPMVQEIAALGTVCLKGFLGQGGHCPERWRGRVTSSVSRHPALGPALAVKIDGASGHQCDPRSNLLKLVQLSHRQMQPPLPRRLPKLGLGASTGTKLYHILLPITGVGVGGNNFFSFEFLSNSIAGRIDLSHVHVSTLRMRRTFRLRR